MLRSIAAISILLICSATSWAIDVTNPSSPAVNSPSRTGTEEVSQAPVATDELNDIQAKIVESFTQNNCDRVATTTNRPLVPRFRPLVIAVVAACSKDHAYAENLFQEAEGKARADELILVLHARYLFAYDEAAADKLWGRIFVIARNPALKKIAQDYLQGTEEQGEALSLTKRWTLFGSWETSGGYENNPTGQAASIGARPASGAFNNVLFGSGSRSLESGNTIGANLSVTTNTYFSTHYADFWENEYDFPYTMRIGTNEDLVFRPLGRYSQYGDLTYEVMVGFALTGVAYRETYKQWVQTAVYQNHYYIDVVQPESGTNLHFEYNWEFYPKDLSFRLMAYIQHVSAQEDTSITPGADIPYSHNDIGTTLFFDYRFKGVTFSFYPSYSIREDDNPSVYEDIFGNIQTKQRTDQSVDFKFRVSTAINRSIEAFAYADWTRTYSNIGFADYLDRNYIDQSFGIGLKTFVANY